MKGDVKNSHTKLTQARVYDHLNKQAAMRQKTLLPTVPKVDSMYDVHDFFKVFFTLVTLCQQIFTTVCMLFADIIIGGFRRFSAKGAGSAVC